MSSSPAHNCSGLTNSSLLPCNHYGTMQVAGAKPNEWFCSMHHKKELAKAAVELAEKRAKEAKHAADPTYHRCVAVARCTAERCQCRGPNAVEGSTADWLCTAHYKEAAVKAARPTAGAGMLIHQQCCGKKKGDCQHPVKYIVDNHYFCHLHNPNIVVKKCMGTLKCKGSGKYEVNGLSYCASHNPAEPRRGGFH